MGTGRLLTPPQRIERLLERIANAIAPDDSGVDSPAVPERLDRVAIQTSRGAVELPWSSRDELLREIRHLESAKPVVAAFDSVGASRPVELDREGMVLIVEAIHAGRRVTCR